MPEPAYKSCAHCGEQFACNAKFSTAQWANVRCCSRACAVRWRYRNNPAKPVRPIRPNYGAKRRIDANGYILIWEPAHAIAMAYGYVLEHRKVAWDASLLTDPELHVHHVNGDKQDNRLANLRVVSGVEHAMLHRDERRQCSGSHPQSSLTTSDVVAMRGELARGVRQVDIAARHGVSQAAVSKINTRQSWAHVA